MSNSGFGQGPKKETVYSGPALEVPVYKRAVMTSDGATVYSGPAPLGATVYSGATSATPPLAQPGTASDSSAGASRGAAIFYFIAAFTAVNMITRFAGIRFSIGLGAARFFADDQTAWLVANLFAIGVFIVLAVFTRHASKAALATGMVLYAGDIVLLLMNEPALNVLPIIVHAFFLWRLFLAFRQISQ